jgi:hypothetical protein
MSSLYVLKKLHETVMLKCIKRLKSFLHCVPFMILKQEILLSKKMDKKAACMLIM